MAKVKFAVKEVAEARGFPNATALADALNLSYSTTYPLWRGTTRRIDVSTLEKLCNLLRVHPGLLITLDSEFSTADLPAPRKPKKKSPAVSKLRDH